MRRLFTSLLKLIVIAVVIVLAARWIFPLPDVTARAPEFAIPASVETRLGQFMAKGEVAHPGLTGVAPIAGGTDALASRLALIEMAEVSIDAQYYIWHDDTSGILLLDALDRAAKRGVRVRLLLDDNGISGLDGFVATLNADPNLDRKSVV